VFQAHPGITGAVNLAGSILLRPAHLTTAQDFEDTISLNLRTAFAVTRAAGKHMKSTGGSVVLMSSCAASVGLPNHEAIAAAKAGVEGLVRAAAATYAGSGIRFNAVAPGLVATPMARRITENEGALKASVAMHPLGRIGQPEEVARAITFLLGEASAWTTGQVLGVDGGLARLKGR
jgi:NAD(P)-dependent dehydrogenase (short-subunit alcohol dehydrogenase family)